MGRLSSRSLENSSDHQRKERRGEVILEKTPEVPQKSRPIKTDIGRNGKPSGTDLEARACNRPLNLPNTARVMWP
jgi:hypothetical protein